MRIFHTKIEGDLQVNEDLVLHGMVTGSIVVLAGGVLTLEGMCNGDITVEETAKAILRVNLHLKVTSNLRPKETSKSSWP
jgi:hypothetical protein